MATTVQTIIDSARYDLVDYVDGVGLGIEFDDTELLNYMNRMVGILDSNLVSLNSDLTENKCQYIIPTTGQSWIDLSSSLNSGNWLDLRSVWWGSNKLNKVSIDRLRYNSMYRSGNAVPYEWAISGRKILFSQGTSAVTNLVTTYLPADWTNVDIANYDETTDLTVTADAVGQYCTMLNAPTTVGVKYTIQITVDNLVGSWDFKDFTGTQTFGSITEDGTYAFTFVAEYTGGGMLVATSATASGDFTAVKLYNFNDVLTIFYDKKTSALALTSSMPYNDTFNEFLREMLVLCAKAKKEGIISKSDGVFNSLFKQRVMQEEISRSFIPRNYNYMEF